MIGCQNTKYTLLMFFGHLRAFWEDQMDPKSALGGPKPISRTGVRCAQDRTLFETPMLALAMTNPKRKNLSSYLIGIF